MHSLYVEGAYFCCLCVKSFTVFQAHKPVRTAVVLLLGSMAVNRQFLLPNV